MTETTGKELAKAGKKKGQFKSGDAWTGNKLGRPKGQRNFSTIFREGLIKLAEKNGTEPDALEEEILQMAIAKARKGDYAFYRDLQDRLHGRPTQRQEITGLDGKDLIPNKQSTEKVQKALDSYLKPKDKK